MIDNPSPTLLLLAVEYEKPVVCGLSSIVFH